MPAATPERATEGGGGGAGGGGVGGVRLEKETGIPLRFQFHRSLRNN